MVRSIAIDWSGARSPRGKLVLAEAASGALRRLEAFDSRERVIQAVETYGTLSERVVVGIDFAFSFPHWFIRDLGVADAFALWDVVRERGERWLDDCPRPFWGRPGIPRWELEAHLRQTEQHVGTALGFRPKSTFQIGGAGAVVKNSPTARRSYMERSQWRLSSHALNAITNSEDAFDAAVSALVMDTHASELATLAPGDSTEMLEGRIWYPNPSASRGS